MGTKLLDFKAEMKMIWLTVDQIRCSKISILKNKILNISRVFSLHIPTLPSYLLVQRLKKVNSIYAELETLWQQKKHGGTFEDVLEMNSPVRSKDECGWVWFSDAPHHHHLLFLL